MSKQKEVIRQSGIYTSSTFLTQLITLIAAFLSRKFLGPTQMGIWSTLQVLVDYSKYAALGTMTAVSIEIPYSVGKGDFDRAEKIKNTAFTFVLIGTFFFCSAIVVFALFTQGRLPSEVTFGLYFVAAIILLQRISNLLIALLRCYKKFQIESGQMIWSSIVNALLVAFLASRFRIYGFIWALGLSFVFNIVYLSMRYRYDFRWCFNRGIFQPLVMRGFPLMLLGVVNTGFQNIDRILIARMLGFELLGLYSIALMTCSFMSNFSGAASSVLVPHFQEKFGEKDNLDDLREYLFKPSLVFALIMPVFISGAWVIVPALIKLLLPKFIPGIAAMKFLALSMFFVPLVQQYQNFLIAIKKHVLIFPVVGFSFALAFGLSVLAMRWKCGIEGVALAMTFSWLVSFSLTYWISVNMFSSIKNALKRFFILLGCFVYLVIFLFGTSRFVSPINSGSLRVVCEGVCVLVFCAPLLFVLNKRFSFLKNLLGGIYS